MIKQIELTEEQKAKIKEIKQVIYENSNNEEHYEIQKLTVLGYAVKEMVDELFSD